jgi:hypothetical protein
MAHASSLASEIPVRMEGRQSSLPPLGPSAGGRGPERRNSPPRSSASRVTNGILHGARINSEPVKAELLQHANEEQQHVDWVAELITQLNGEADFNPAGLASRSHSEYQEGSHLTEMIKEDLIESGSQSNLTRISCVGWAMTM